MRKHCAVVFSLLASTAHAADTVTIHRTVSDCINFVHSLKGTSPYQSFDAYYNSDTNRIETSAMYGYQELALMQFNRCMAMHAMPVPITKLKR
jgi:hypothetical protein